MEECQRCHEIDYDRRTLFMSCGYDMSELNMPLETMNIEDKSDNWIKFYIIRVCKACRSDWMQVQQLWFHTIPTHLTPLPNSGIYMRKFGASVEVSENEFYEQSSCNKR